MLSPFLSEQRSVDLCGIILRLIFAAFSFFHLDFFFCQHVFLCFSVYVASIFLLLLFLFFFSTFLPRPCSDQSGMHSSVLRRCLLTLLNWPLKQGRTGQSCRTCWLTSETQRICLTCSLPRLLSPGPALSGSTSTKGTEPMKVLSSATADLKLPPLWIASSFGSFSLTRLSVCLVPSGGADLSANIREVFHYGHRRGHGERAGPGGACWAHRGQRGRQPSIRCQ